MTGKRMNVWLALATFVVTLCMGLVLPGHPGITAAGAAGIFGEEDLLEFLPVGDITGDGETAVDLQLLALTNEGAPLEGLKAKISSTAGECGELEYNGNGTYFVEFTPPRVTSKQDVTITIRARVGSRSLTSRSLSINVIPPAWYHMAITANPAQLVLGQDTSSSITIQLDPIPQDPSEVQLGIETNVGEVSNLTPMGNGKYTALFTPPAVNYPHLAIITVVERHNPGRSYGYLVAPLVGKTDFPVTQLPPGAQATMHVGDQTYGPVLASSSGQASIPITVPPGISSATLDVIGQGQRTIDLRIPEARRLKIFPLHSGIPADNSQKIPIRVLVLDALGQPVQGEPITITADVGTISSPSFEGDGVYRADYTPPLQATSSQVTFNASLNTSASVQTDSATTTLVPIRPASLTLKALPEELAYGDTSFHVLAKLTAPNGTGLAGRKLIFTSNGARLQGSPTDLKLGDYQAAFETTGSGPVEITATAMTPSTGNPMDQLVIVPTRTILPNDGLSSSMLSIFSLDQLGYPTSQVPLDITIQAGDGSIPTAATTDDYGLAQVYYTAGREPGLVRISVSSGSHSSAIALLQAPAGTVSLATLPRSGTPATLSNIARWSASVTGLDIQRQGASGAAMLPAVSPAATTSDNPVQSILVSSLPEQVSAGDSVLLVIKALDQQGLGVPHQSIDIIASTGMVTGLTDKGTGEYQARLNIPTDATEQVKVSVVANEGQATGFLRLTLAPPPAATEEPAATPWLQAEPAEPQPVAQPAEPQPEPTEQEPTSPAQEPEPTPQTQPQPISSATEQEPRHSWLRARAAVASMAYRYLYTVHDDILDLVADGDPRPYDQTLELSGNENAIDGTEDPTPLAVPGLDILAGAWLPQFPYVGMEARFRTIWYGVDTDSWTEAHEGVDLSWVDHFLTLQLKARYFYDAGDHRFSLGISGGTVSTSVPLVAEWQPSESDPRGIWFFPWGFTSFYGGIQASAELGMGLDIYASGALGSELYSGVFARDFDLELAYTLIDHLSVNLGFNWLKRDVLVPTDTSADEYLPMVTAEDKRSGLFLGAGTLF